MFWMRDERLIENLRQTRRDDVRQDRTARGGADRLALELEVLCALCGGAGTTEQRQALSKLLGSYRFSEPEHQVVFESLCAMSSRRELSAAVLALHLNNRGFPDLDLEKYFSAAPPSVEQALARVDELRSAPNADDGVAQKRISQS
jgi:hypothetical protein